MDINELFLGGLILASAGISMMLIATIMEVLQ